MEKPIEAIPTVYRGVQLRSRLESQACYLFDKLRWQWDYEPYSYLLSDGVQYRPDFWIPDHRMFVETRGYKTERGEEQLVSFSVAIIRGEIMAGAVQAERFLILQTGYEPSLAETGKDMSRPPSPLLYQCHYCRRWIIKRQVGLCYLCGEIHYESTDINMSDDGHILINGNEVQYCDFEGPKRV